jgi:hypothetical protein
MLGTGLLMLQDIFWDWLEDQFGGGCENGFTHLNRQKKIMIKAL